MTPAQRKAITKAFGPAAVDFLNGLAEGVAALHTRQEALEKQIGILHKSNVAQASALDGIKGDVEVYQIHRIVEYEYRCTAKYNEAMASVRESAEALVALVVLVRENAETARQAAEVRRIEFNVALQHKTDKRRPFMDWLFGPRVPV